MDGGLSDNNPCMLAMQELQKMAPGLSRADHFVSIGTGISRTREVAQADVYPSLLFGNSSLQHTFRHYWTENFDGDKRFANMRQMLAVSLPGGGTRSEFVISEVSRRRGLIDSGISASQSACEFLFSKMNWISA